MKISGEKNKMEYYKDIKRCGMGANESTLHPSTNLKKENHYRSKDGLQHGSVVCIHFYPTEY